MKSLFLAIRAPDLEKVRSLLDEDPDLVHATAKQPPKKDDGQSPLQVAFKTNHHDIADLLMDRGADVNFMEKTSINEWRAPVIHDAIRSAMFSSRFMGAGGKPASTSKQFDRAFASLKKLIEKGADAKAVDSYGNNCLMRAAMDASQLNLDEKSQDASSDVGQVFALLIGSGADINQKTRTRPSVAKDYAGTFIERFLTKT
jgi:ankyrin repeat protein